MTLRFLPCCLSIGVLLVSVQGCVIHIHDPGGASGHDWGRENSVRGSGRLAEEIYTFTDITGVQLATLGELEIQLGDTEELRIEADDNLLPYVEAEQDGDILKIGTPRGTWLQPSETVRYTLTVRELMVATRPAPGPAGRRARGTLRERRRLAFRRTPRQVEFVLQALVLTLQPIAFTLGSYQLAAQAGNLALPVLDRARPIVAAGRSVGASAHAPVMPDTRNLYKYKFLDPV